MPNEATKVYLSIEGGGARCIVQGDLSLLGRLLETLAHRGADCDKPEGVLQPARPLPVEAAHAQS